MPDINMCADAEGCLRKSFCYRNVAIPSERQSWDNYWLECAAWDCTNFMEVRKNGRQDEHRSG